MAFPPQLWCSDTARSPHQHRSATETRPSRLLAGNKQQPLGCQDDASAVSKSGAQVRHSPRERSQSMFTGQAFHMLLASTYIQASPLHPAQPHTSNAHTQPTQGMKERADCAGRPQMRRPKCSSGAKAVTYLAWKIPVLNSCMKVFIASFQPSSDISGFTCVTPALCSWLHLNELILTLH